MAYNYCKYCQIFALFRFSYLCIQTKSRARKPRDAACFCQHPI